MYYTYVLKQEDKGHFYVGLTNNLEERLREHQQGLTRSTKGRNWGLHCYFAFTGRKVAEGFESYLKTGSGRAFSKRHFGVELDEA